jgi:hypothetical protein
LAFTRCNKSQAEPSGPANGKWRLNVIGGVQGDDIRGQ